LGIAAITARVPAAASRDQTNTRSRSSTFAAGFAAAIPSAMPTPNAVTTSPQPGLPPWTVSATNTGPVARTAPTAPNAIAIPPVIAAAIVSSARNRTPSRVSRQTRERSMCGRALPRVLRIAIPATIAAENRNVPASKTRASDSGWFANRGTRALMLCATPYSTANAAPPIGRVAYALTSTREFAFASCRRGTMLGNDASRAGPQSNDRHSITNDSR
jgi:hypothetical protein